MLIFVAQMKNIQHTAKNIMTRRGDEQPVCPKGFFVVSILE